MAVIRCPHCGKPNPDFLQVCQYCDKPLASAAAPSPGEPAPVQPESDLPDWLQTNTGPLTGALDDSALGGAAPETGDVPDWLKDTLNAPPASSGTLPLGEPSAEAPAPADIPDWLKSMTGPLSAESAAPAPAAMEGELPDWLKPAASAAPEADVPDWLKSLGGTSSLPAQEPAAPEPAPAETPDWLQGQTGALTPAAEGEVPDWLRSLSSPAPAEGAQPAPESDVPDWLKAASTPPAQPEADVPDWLKETTGPLTPPAAPKGTAPFTAPLEEADVPDWLKEATGPLPPLPSASPGTAPFSMPVESEPEWAAQPATPAEDETPDWLKSLGADVAPAEAAPQPAPEPVASAEPDWMRDLGEPAMAAAEPAAAEPEAAIPTEAGAEPDWLASLRQDSALAGAAAAVSMLPATAPFGAPPAAEEEPAAALTPSGAEPDWLAALRAAPPSEPESPAGPPLELAQGELPAWLSAMRPVDVQPSAVEREVDEYQETVGVLTGMKGVLRAEPSVVLPGRSARQVHALSLSPAQKTQADMLAAMLAEDRAETPVTKRAARKWPWERWAVALALLLGVLIPGLVFRSPTDSAQFFLTPTEVPVEVRDTRDFLEGLSLDKPVLVAFDYEPAQAGEMRPIAEVVLTHLMLRGARVASLSTSLAGAGESAFVLDEMAGSDWLLGNGRVYRYGEHYLNLGYLPGGPVGILQFTLNPRSVVQSDFQNNALAGGLWAQPAVGGVSTLDDFGAAIVLSATPEDARAWVEQTQGRTTPLVLLVSGGAGPMVRPYYEADPARIRVFMSGPLTTLQYVRAQPNVSDAFYGEALLRWQMLGGGLLTSALLMVLGAVAYGLAKILRRSGRVRA